MKQDYVTHSGIITHITDSTLTLHTDGSGNCDGCAVASLCNKDTNSGGESIIIDTPEARCFSVGQQVEAVASSSSTLRATWWALILPTILFIGVVLIALLLWPGLKSWSLLIGFIFLAVYDLLLYVFRKRIAQKIRWTVRPVSEN